MVEEPNLTRWQYLEWGVNDLRPDPSPIITSFSTDMPIPQVGDEVLVEMEVSNLTQMLKQKMSK